MKISVYAAALAAISFSTALPENAAADPKPKGAKAPTAQSVGQIYAGNTSNWKSCKGGIYFGANGKAQAYCAKGNGSVGLGKWSLNSKAQVCYDMTYYWNEGGSVSSKKEPRECMSHLVDSDGQLWVNWTGYSDWWRFDAKKSVAKGFKYKQKHQRLVKKLGL